MIDNKKLVNDIKQNHENIAIAISMAFADGNIDDAKRFYKRFYPVIKEETDCFFLDIRDEFKTEYENKINDIVRKIESYLEKDIKQYVFNDSKLKASLSCLDQNVIFEHSDDLIELCEKLYNKNKNKYRKIGVSFSDFVSLYSKKGEQGLKTLNKYVNELSKKIVMYSYRKEFSKLSDLHKSKIASKSFLEMQTEYNVRNLNDLLELNEEISAFLIDIEEVSGEQKVIVEAKRNSFRQRMNKNEDFVLQEKEAMFLQRKISDIYNNHIFCEIFKTTNFKEFFEFYGYEINSKNLGYAVFLYFDILNSVANCSKLTFGENNKSLCLFKLNQIININCEEQNNLILHEFVHSVDSYDGSCIVKSFADLFNFLNEALTEYLAIDSLKYLKNNILNIDNVPKERTVVSTYVCMLPLVEKLKSSCIWNDLLIAKLDGNDVEFIEKRIGYGNLKTIEECFSQTYKNMDDKQILEENSAKLDKILSKMKLRSKQNV